MFQFSVTQGDLGEDIWQKNSIDSNDKHVFEGPRRVSECGRDVKSSFVML